MRLPSFMFSFSVVNYISHLFLLSHRGPETKNKRQEIASLQRKVIELQTDLTQELQLIQQKLVPARQSLAAFNELVELRIGLVEPLLTGNHTIHFKSSLICSEPDCADPNFVKDVQYKVISN